MSKEAVLAAFEMDIQKGDPRQGELTIEEITRTAKTLISTDRAGVIDALRFWLDLRDPGLTIIALDVIADIYIPELKPDLQLLRAEIESGKVFHPSYVYWVDRALNDRSENPK